MPGTLKPQTWQSNPAIYAPTKYKRACNYEAFVPDKVADIPFSLEAGVAGMVSEAEHAIHALNEHAGPRLDALARLLLRTESIASSNVEGMQLGVRELARAEARAESGQRASETATDVLANVDAMILAVEKAAVVNQFGVSQITDIHQRLMARAENGRAAGALRTQQNWIGGNDYNPCGADFVPPPPEDLDELLLDLCEAINDDRLSPLVQAAMVHAQFETIHPFDDGNGRTGRALIHVVLRRRGIAPRYVPPISVSLAAAKTRYIAGLNSFRGDDVGKWIEYFAAAASRSAHLAQTYLASVRALMETWRAQVSASARTPRSDAAIWALIDVLPAHPMISAPVAAAATGRAKAAVYEAIEQLRKAGVLIPLSDARRNRSWEAAGLLDLIADMESGQLS